nr:hypothetical protein [Mucilaginibacter humi]
MAQAKLSWQVNLSVNGKIQLADLILFSVITTAPSCSGLVFEDAFQ